MKNFILLTLISIVFSSQSNAFEVKSSQNRELKNKFQDWYFFKTNNGDQEICYLLSTPISTQRDALRSKAFFVVTNNKDDADEISTSSGFIYKQNSNVELSFGSNRFYLFPYRNFAWANDKNEDIDIIKEMQKKDVMSITAISKNDKIVIDNYSLIGFFQAYRNMKQNCE